MRTNKQIYKANKDKRVKALGSDKYIGLDPTGFSAGEKERKGYSLWPPKWLSWESLDLHG